MKTFADLQPQTEKIQRRALFIGVGALLLCLGGAFIDRAQFFQSYLFAYLFWIGIPTAGIALVGLHHLVGGGWGFAIQRILEAAARTLPLMILLFLPFAFGMSDLFIWARPEVLAGDALLRHKAPYLNVPFFWVRAAGYFAVWGFFTFQLTRWSYKMDESGQTAPLNSIAKASGPALLFYVLTATFASFDWAMSLDPHWFSTIFGFYFVIGQTLLTLSFAIIVVRKLAAVQPLAAMVRAKHFHDLGNLMLAFIALWAYISFSQFLIIWSGNLPEELPWYLHRTRGGWQYLAIFVALFHFVVPFSILLSRRSKRNIETLARVAYGMIIMRLVDLYWIIKPNFHPEQISLHWLDVAAPLAVGGLWAAYFLHQLRARPVLPVHDPRVKEAFSDE
jgi:hypothetical protein